jgi:SAM-dependent methyltransferase
MYFRRTLLIFSITMIAFCLTLYFQSEETVKSVNIDTAMNLPFREDRAHSLADFNEKIKPHDLEDLIQLVYEKNKMAGEKTRVMEIGSGSGRVIMELKKQFPDIEFYGVNKEKSLDFYRRESFAVTAVSMGIMEKAELEGMDLPYVVFADLDFGGRLPYSNNKFDVIYSQNTIKYFKYKFELLDEILRLLKPEGISILSDLPPINIYKNGVVMEEDEAFLEFRKRGIEVNLLENDTSLMLKKRGDSQKFPVSPHQPIPENVENLSQEFRRPEMGYNLL